MTSKLCLHIKVLTKVPFVCPPGEKQFVRPLGTNISHTQGEANFFCVELGMKQIYIEGGGQIFYVGGIVGSYYVDEKMDEIKVNILVSKASKLPVSARLLGAHRSQKF